MGESRVDVVVAVHRVNLSLASKAAEGSGEDHSVVVLVKGAAAHFLRTGMGLSQAFAVQQGVPVQGYRLQSIGTQASAVERALARAHFRT